MTVFGLCISIWNVQNAKSGRTFIVEYGRLLWRAIAPNFLLQCDENYRLSGLVRKSASTVSRYERELPFCKMLNNPKPMLLNINKVWCASSTRIENARLRNHYNAFENYTSKARTTYTRWANSPVTPFIVYKVYSQHSGLHPGHWGDHLFFLVSWKRMRNTSHKPSEK